MYLYHSDHIIFCEDIILQQFCQGSVKQLTCHDGAPYN